MTALFLCVTYFSAFQLLCKAVILKGASQRLPVAGEVPTLIQ